MGCLDPCAVVRGPPSEYINVCIIFDTKAIDLVNGEKRRRNGVCAFFYHCCCCCFSRITVIQIHAEKARIDFFCRSLQYRSHLPLLEFNCIATIHIIDTHSKNGTNQPSSSQITEQH